MGLADFAKIAKEAVKNHREAIETSYTKKFQLVDDRQKNYNNETDSEREMWRHVEIYQKNLTSRIKLKFDLLVEEDTRKNFKIFDEDLNGGIEKEEFVQKFLDLGLTDDKEFYAYIDMIFTKYDKDGNNKIDYNEFKVMSEYEKPFCNDELIDRIKYLYNKWDVDNDNNVTIDEIRKRFQDFNPNILNEECFTDLVGKYFFSKIRII